MTNYQRGTRFEYQVLDDFRDKGYIAIRAAGSHTPADVYAFKRGKEYVFVQCKRDGRLDPKEWNAFLDYCYEAGAVPVLAEKLARGIKYHLVIGRKEKRGKQPYQDWSIDE